MDIPNEHEWDLDIESLEDLERAEIARQFEALDQLEAIAEAEQAGMR